MMANDIDPTMKQHALHLAQQEWDTGTPRLGSYLGEFVEQSDKQCLAWPYWFAVQTEGRHEAMAISSIAGRGLPTYLPKVARKESRGRGQYRTITRPMFPGYAFVNCDAHPEHWQRISSARGVRSLTSIAGRPVPIRRGEIEVIRLVEAQNTLPDERSRFFYHFSEGDTVRIKFGPFAMFHAQLESAVDEHGRIEALVSLFGRQSRIQLSADDVEAL